MKLNPILPYPMVGVLIFIGFIALISLAAILIREWKLRFKKFHDLEDIQLIEMGIREHPGLLRRRGKRGTDAKQGEEEGEKWSGQAAEEFAPSINFGEGEWDDWWEGSSKSSGESSE